MLVSIKDDFSLDKIARSGQCFRASIVEDKYRFITEENIIYIKHIKDDTFEISCDNNTFNEIWQPYFDLNRNYRNIVNSINDPFFEIAAKEGKGIRVLKQNAWEMVVSFIISQRKSIPAIIKSVEALCKVYGKPIQTEYELIYTFPTPEQLAIATPEGLKECSLGYRVPYVIDAVEKVLTKEIDLNNIAKLDDVSMLTELKKVKGIGDKVANCIMLFAYGRTASVPIDTWIQKIIEYKYNGENPFLAYGNNAGIIQQYAFYYVQQNKIEFT